MLTPLHKGFTEERKPEHFHIYIIYLMLFPVNHPYFHFPGLSLFPFADANVSNTTYDYNLDHISYRYFGKKRLQAQRFQQFIPTFQLFTF